MSPAIEIIGICFLLPAVVGLCISWLCLRGPWNSELSERYAFVVGALAGFWIAYALVPWHEWTPNTSWHWLPYLILLAGLWGAVAVAPGIRNPERWLTWLALSVVAAGLLVPDFEELSGTRVRWIWGSAASLFVILVLLDFLVVRFPGRLQSVLFVATALVAAGVLVLSGNNKFAQLELGFAGGLLAGAVWQERKHSPLATRALLPSLLIALLGLLETGYLYSFSTVPALSYLLVGIAPLGQIVACVPPLSRASTRSQHVARCVGVALLVCVGLGLAVWADLQASAY